MEDVVVLGEKKMVMKCKDRRVSFQDNFSKEVLGEVISLFI